MNADLNIAWSNELAEKSQNERKVIEDWFPIEVWILNSDFARTTELHWVGNNSELNSEFDL
jgi:hypothetical protein